MDSGGKTADLMAIKGVHAEGKQLRAWMCVRVCARACERAYPCPCVREGAVRCGAVRNTSASLCLCANVQAEETRSAAAPFFFFFFILIGPLQRGSQRAGKKN